MISFDCLLLADAPLTRTFEWGRIQSGYEGWLGGGVLVVLLALTVLLYVFDTHELPWYFRVGLPLLRTLVSIGLLLVWLQPRWRSSREVRVDSRVLMLVDTSLSMARVNPDKPGQTRLQQVAAGLDETEFLARLQEKHHVTVVPFNSVLEKDRRVVLPMKASRRNGQCIRHTPCAAPRHTECAGYMAKQLVPGGIDTRLGEALEQLLRNERGGPISGVVLVSDGGQNAGESPDTALELAQESHIPVYTIGVGSKKKPVNVRVAEFNVPSRVFPGERYSVDGSIQGFGMTGTVQVELLARDGADAKDPNRRGKGTLVDSVNKVLLSDGQAVPVKFKLPPSQVGHRVLCLRVKAPKGSAAGTMYPWSSNKFLEGEVACLRAPDSRAAPGGRSLARLPVSPHAPLPRQVDEGQRPAAIGPVRHVAGGHEHPRRLPRFAARAGRLRLYRGLRSRLEGTAARAGRLALRLG